MSIGLRRVRLVTLVLATAFVLAATRTITAQAGLYVYVPNNSGVVGVFLTKADGTLTSLTTIPTGLNPLYAVVSMDNRFAYVSNRGSNNVVVISTATQSIIQTVGTGSAPVGLALSPNGQRMYVANNTASTISGYAVDTATGRLTSIVTIPTGAGSQPRELVVSSDGSYLYVTDQAVAISSVYLILLNTNSIVATIPVGNQPFGIALSPDGGRLYVANAGGSSISVIDTAARGVIGTLTTGVGSPRGVTVSPDGRYFYAGMGNSNFFSQFSANPLGPLVPRDVTTASAAEYVAITPSGALAYVVDGGASNTVRSYSVNTATGQMSLIGPVLSSGGTGAFSLGLQSRYAPAAAPGPIPPNSGKPSAPRGVSVKRNNLALVVDFSPPQIANTPDLNDLRYRVYVDNADGNLFGTFDTRSSGVLVQNVKNELAYYVRVTAINGFGEGEASAAVLVAAPDWAFYPKDKDGRPCPSPQPCQ